MTTPHFYEISHSVRKEARPMSWNWFHTLAARQASVKSEIQESNLPYRSFSMPSRYRVSIRPGSADEWRSIVCTVAGQRT